VTEKKKSGKKAEPAENDEKKRSRGKPLKYKTVEQMQEKIDTYFESCWDNVPIRNKYGSVITKKDKETGEEEPIYERVQVRPYTVTGLAVALDMSREGILNYQNKRGPEYFGAIKKAKDKIEQYAEEQLYILKNPAGAIFNLTNNYKSWINKKYDDKRIEFEEKRLDLEREKVNKTNTLLDAVTERNQQMQTLADMINMPTPDRSARDFDEKE